MRKTGLLVISLIACVCLFTAGKIIDKNKTDGTTDPTHFEKDILPGILALNGDERYKPKKNFRTGHVTPAKLDNYLRKTEDGYCIQLPSHTNIPTPAVIDGNIYIGAGFGSKQYYSFDAITGDLKWGINLDDDGPSSPAIQDGHIVFNTESCTIFCCDLLTGKHIWSYWLGDPLMSMPTIANGMVFTAYPAHYEGLPYKNEQDTANRISLYPTHVLIAFDLKTGDIRWQKWIDSDVMSAPVAKDDLLYLTTFSGALYKIEQQTGKILEAKATRATSAPVLDKKNQLIVSKRTDSPQDSVLTESVVMGYGTFSRVTAYEKPAYYLDKKVQEKSKLKNDAAKMDAGNGFTNGAPATSNFMAAFENIGQSNVSTLQSFQGSRGLYRDGNLYNTMGDEVVCMDSSGKVKWKHKLDGDAKKEGGFMGAPPIYVNGHIIVATLTGDILIMDEKEGKIIKKYAVKEPVRYQPLAENGWIYVTTTTCKLYAINTGNPAITGWNMWGGNAARTNVGRISNSN